MKDIRAGKGSDNFVRTRAAAPWVATAFRLLSVLIILMGLALPAIDAISGPDDGRGGRLCEIDGSPDCSDGDADDTGLPASRFQTVFLDGTFFFSESEGLRPWSRALSLYKPPR